MPSDLSAEESNRLLAAVIALRVTGCAPASVQRFRTGARHHVFDIVFKGRPPIVVRIGHPFARREMAGALYLSSCFGRAECLCRRCWPRTCRQSIIGWCSTACPEPILAPSSPICRTVSWTILPQAPRRRRSSPRIPAQPGVMAMPFGRRRPRTPCGRRCWTHILPGRGGASPRPVCSMLASSIACRAD